MPDLLYCQAVLPTSGIESIIIIRIKICTVMSNFGASDGLLIRCRGHIDL